MPPTRNLRYGRLGISALAMLHLTETAEGQIRVSVHYEPPIDTDGAHVMTNIEAVAARMIRAAIDAGAREVS
jgi:hypothetical protein